MAFNPSPKVAAARDYAAANDQEMVIILSVDKEGRVTSASYGKTKGLCDVAGQLLNTAHVAVERQIEEWGE